MNTFLKLKCHLAVSQLHLRSLLILPLIVLCLQGCASVGEQENGGASGTTSSNANSGSTTATWDNAKFDEAIYGP